MFRKLQMLLLMLTCSVLAAQAQGNKKTALVKGHVVNKATKAPANETQVSLPRLQRLTTTDGDGNFTLSEVPYGDHELVIGGASTKPDTISISVNQDVVDLGDLEMTPNEAATSQQSIQIPTIALEESDVANDEEGTKTQNVSGLLTASRDPFINTAAFVFGPYRFQPRGYERNSQQVLINGAPMNDVETGDAYWSQWGGLNDVFRTRSSTYGLQPSEYAFGGVNGTVAFDATAANQRKQTRLTYSLANRNYNNRLMLTQSSGLMSNGWAYSVSLSKRWAKEGYVDGTFYDGYSYYASVSKRIKKAHTISLTTFGAPTRRGKAAPAIQEAYDLAGTNYYNPNWGYLNGEKRNAKVAENYQPIYLLNYEYAPSDKTRWTTTVGYQYGKNSNSTLDWYNAADPRPDYYRNFPSYWEYSGNPALADQIRQDLMAHPEKMQIQWDNLYQANYFNKVPMLNPDGSPTGDSARRSLYVIGKDVDDIKKWIFNTNLERVINEHITLTTGISFIHQRTESYRQLDDLLGGDFYVNLNQFAERNYAGNNMMIQNDVNNPNRIIRVGDKYYYDYINNFNKGWWWGQATFTYNKVDFFLAANYGFNTFDRDGLYRNGLYADGNDSYGKSALQKFALYGLKGGITYKINGRHYLFVNAALSSDAPTVDNTFISARTRNFTVDNPQEQLSQTLEGGYLMHSPRVNVRAVGYVTDVKHATDIERFYLEGTANTFVNYAIQDMSMRFIGTELAIDYKLNSSLSVTGVAALGEAFYSNNPKVTPYQDNYLDSTGTNNGLAKTETAYMKNLYLSVGPQSSYSLGFNYRSKKYWYANINFNYFDRNYVDVNPSRRITEAVETLQPGSPEWNTIVGQEELPDAFTVDLFGGKSFLLSKISKKIPRNVFLYVNAGISNLFDNQNIRTGGFEQLRYDYTTGNPSEFPPKYFYAYGRNFFVNVSLKF